MSPRKLRCSSNRIQLWRCAATLAFALIAAPAAQAIRPTFGVEARPAKTTSLSVPLSGTGVQATVTFSAPSPALTSSPADMTVKNGAITVTNTGTGALTLTAAPTIAKTAGTTASKFSIAGGSCASGMVIAAAGGTCTIAVRYTPANTTASTARVTLTDNGADKGMQLGANFSGN